MSVAYMMNRINGECVVVETERELGRYVQQNKAIMSVTLLWPRFKNLVNFMLGLAQ